MSASSWNSKIDAHAASPFLKRVWKAMLRVPKGKVATYGDLAHAIGQPAASRAIGMACNKNPFAPEVPCHRIVTSTGSLGGYALGLEKKIRLLKTEGISVKDGKIQDFDSVRVNIAQLKR